MALESQTKKRRRVRNQRHLYDLGRMSLGGECVGILVPCMASPVNKTDSNRHLHNRNARGPFDHLREAVGTHKSGTHADAR